MSYSNLLTQSLTYWSPASNDGTGDLIYNTPVAILGRYQQVVDNYQDSNGEEWISDGVVYTGTQLVQNGFIYPGTSVASDPQDVEGAYRVRRLSTSQNPNGSIIVYKCVLG